MMYSFLTNGSTVTVILFLGICGPAFISVLLQRWIKPWRRHI